METPDVNLSSFLQGLKGSAKVILKPFLSLMESEDRVLSVVNGIAGDSIAQYAPRYSIDMAFYEQGERLELKNLDWKKRRNECSKNVVVLVHGHSDLETSWFDKRGNSIGSVLHEDLGYTPFYVRYNTGLHISTNGHKLSALLEELVENYPVKIKKLVLIGHSMGGLVVRSAAHYGQDQTWIQKLDSLIMLGAPHEGAYMEKLGSAAEIILKKLMNPATVVIGEILKKRSAGIRDLRYGYITDEDWQNEKAYSTGQHRKPLPILKNVNYYVIAASLSKKENSWLNRFIGDGVVTMRSAQAQKKGRDSDLPLDPQNTKVIRGINHYAMMRDSEVIRQISVWLGARRTLASL